MSNQSRICKRSEVEHIRAFLNYAKQSLNDAWYFPQSYGYQYLVALALYSKSLTVAEATLVLLEAGFSDEAFGMTRTLVDIFLTLRYITNKDTDARAKRYADFAAKSGAVWAEVVKIYWPDKVQSVSSTGGLLATYIPPSTLSKITWCKLVTTISLCGVETNKI
jgi:Family of unknown function (DUF5677)